MKNRPHDAAVVELLKADPDFANEYLAAALDEADEPGGDCEVHGISRNTKAVCDESDVAARTCLKRSPAIPFVVKIAVQIPKSN